MSFFPSLPRMPSEPFTQPALSSNAFALSILNSKLVFLERKRCGLFTKFEVAMPVRP